MGNGKFSSTVIDAIGEEQHRAHVALVISSVQGLYKRRQVRQLVGEIELLEITDFLAEKVFIDLKISVQVFPKLLKLGKIILFVIRRILAKDDGGRIVMRKDNGWRFHRTEFLPNQRVEKQQNHQANHQRSQRKQNDCQWFAIVLFLVSEIQQCGRCQTCQQRQS